MTTFRKMLHPVLIVLTGFLSLTASLGGLALIANFYAPPVEQLGSSIFKSFTLPGLALLLMVGGSALFATLLLIRGSKYALLFANTAAVIILFFEFIEVLVIGSPAGPAQFMQVLYVGIGTLIAVCAMGMWFIDLRAGSQPGVPGSR